MKRWLMALGLIAGLTGSVRAEDSASLWLNYYKERSTRVAAPMLTVRKSLPADTQVEATFLVDQITSASGAFTTEDEPFTEYRLEGRLDGKMTFGNFTPGLSLRYSGESDYKSVGFGGNASYKLFDDATTLAAYFRLNLDTVGFRPNPDFLQKLRTTYFGASWTQIMRRDLIGGMNTSVQLMRGYTENPYRQEQHPEHRNRYSVGGWLRYRIAADMTLRGEYCFHADTWDLFAHTFDVRIRHDIGSWIWLEPRVRFHTQSAVFFLDRTNIPNPEDPIAPIEVNTSDPKLEAIQTYSAGLRASFRLENTWNMQIQPSYMLYHQTNRYGTAHIVQLGFYVPL